LRAFSPRLRARARQDDRAAAEQLGVVRSPAWFLGDLEHSWVASLAGAMPAGSRLFESAGDVPDDWPEASHAAGPTNGAERVGVLDPPRRKGGGQ
jgi:hypothetical protein